MTVNSPVALHLALFGVKDYRMGVQDRGGPSLNMISIRERADRNPIDRDQLLMRSILIEDLQGFDNSFQQVARIMRNTFDTVWNATGFGRSLHYNDDGDWTGDVHMSS